MKLSGVDVSSSKKFAIAFAQQKRLKKKKKEKMERKKMMVQGIAKSVYRECSSPTGSTKFGTQEQRGWITEMRVGRSVSRNRGKGQVGRVLLELRQVVARKRSTVIVPLLSPSPAPSSSSSSLFLYTMCQILSMFNVRVCLYKYVYTFIDGLATIQTLHYRVYTFHANAYAHAYTIPMQGTYSRD